MNCMYSTDDSRMFETIILIFIILILVRKWVAGIEISKIKWIKESKCRSRYS